MTKYPYILYTGGNTLTVNEKEKPDYEPDKYKRHSEGLSRHDYNMQEWEKSCKQIQIAEGHEELFKSYTGSVFAKKHGGFVTEHSLGFQKALESGIQIPADKVRFEFIFGLDKNANSKALQMEPIETAYFISNETEAETNEAIEFGEFLRKEYAFTPSTTALKPKWIKKENINKAVLQSGEYYSTKELYSIFKSTRK